MPARGARRNVPDVTVRPQTAHPAAAWAAAAWAAALPAALVAALALAAAAAQAATARDRRTYPPPGQKRLNGGRARAHAVDRLSRLGRRICPPRRMADHPRSG